MVAKVRVDDDDDTQNEWVRVCVCVLEREKDRERKSVNSRKLATLEFQAKYTLPTIWNEFSNICPDISSMVDFSNKILKIPFWINMK